MTPDCLLVGAADVKLAMLAKARADEVEKRMAWIGDDGGDDVVRRFIFDVLGSVAKRKMGGRRALKYFGCRSQSSNASQLMTIQTTPQKMMENESTQKPGAPSGDQKPFGRLEVEEEGASGARRKKESRASCISLCRVAQNPSPS